MRAEIFSKTLNRNDVWEIERKHVDDDGQTYEEVLATADTETLADKIMSILQGDDVASQEPRIADYLANGGNHCPICKSESIEADGSEWEGNQVFSEVYCNDCGATWDDVFTLENVVNLKEPHH